MRMGNSTSGPEKEKGERPGVQMLGVLMLEEFLRDRR